MARLTKDVIGKLEVEGVEYSVNAEFQQGALQLADEIDLDEIEAGKIFLEGRDDADVSGRSVLACSIIRFHQRRKYLLDSLRLLLQIAADVDQPEHIRDGTGEIIWGLLQIPNGGVDASKFVRKCLSSMGDIKTWLHQLTEKLNRASVPGQGAHPELLEIVEYQRVSLLQQHESLGIILLYLVKAKHSTVAEFELVLETLKKADRFDNLLRKHCPSNRNWSSSSCHISVIENGDRIRWLTDCSSLLPRCWSVYSPFWCSRRGWVCRGRKNSHREDSWRER